MERRRKKKGFHLGNSNMIKMCCLNGDHLVCATEDDFLVVSVYSSFITIVCEHYKSPFIILSYEKSYC